MPIFIVATTNPNIDATLKAKITRYFPNDYYEIGRGQWLVSFNGIAKTLFERLAEGNQQAMTDSVVFGINGYYGFASNNMWEWIATKMRGQGAW